MINPISPLCPSSVSSAKHKFKAASASQDMSIHKASQTVDFNTAAAYNLIDNASTGLVVRQTTPFESEGTPSNLPEAGGARSRQPFRPEKL
jgi:hypothetical protein